jgi:hypothetical protein
VHPVQELFMLCKSLKHFWALDKEGQRLLLLGHFQLCICLCSQATPIRKISVCHEKGPLGQHKVALNIGLKYTYGIEVSKEVKKAQKFHPEEVLI